MWSARELHSQHLGLEHILCIFYYFITRDLTTIWFKKNTSYIFKRSFSAYICKTNFEVDLKKHSSPKLKNVSLGFSGGAFACYDPGFNPVYHTTNTLTGKHLHHTHTQSHRNAHTHIHRTHTTVLYLHFFFLTKQVFKIIPIKGVEEMSALPEDLRLVPSIQARGSHWPIPSAATNTTTFSDLRGHWHTVVEHPQLHSKFKARLL